MDESSVAGLPLGHVSVLWQDVENVPNWAIPQWFSLFRKENETRRRNTTKIKKSKMAAVRFVVSQPLCAFCWISLEKRRANCWKAHCWTFTVPKICLLRRNSCWRILVRFSLSFPHVPQQRQGDNRAVRDVDDMFTLLTTLDEAENVTYILCVRKPGQYPLYQTVWRWFFGFSWQCWKSWRLKLNLMESAKCTVAKDINKPCVQRSAQLEPGVQLRHYCSGHLVRPSQYNVT